MQGGFDFLRSLLADPSSVGIGLAVVFGAIWFACYRPPVFRKPWLWAILLGSAILTSVAIAFIQMPLQIRGGQVLNHFWGHEVGLQRLLFTGVLVLLVGGLVQEGAKLLPVAVCWWCKGKKVDPKLGLEIGAMAGLGFGVLEAQHVHNAIFASGWSWEIVQINGVVELAKFWESFYFVAFHAAASALAGYGLAKGWGWQFYLLASVLHVVLKYTHVLSHDHIISEVQAELFISLWAMLITAVAHWLGERKQEHGVET